MENAIKAGAAKTHAPLRFIDYVPEIVQRVDINKASSKELSKILGLSDSVISKIVSARKKNPIRNTAQLKTVLGKITDATAKAMNRMVFAFREQVEILNCEIENVRIFSDKPFELRVSFAAPTKGNASLVSTTILWKGTPFTVQQHIQPDENKSGILTVKFNKGFSLPAGLINIQVSVYDDDGGADTQEFDTWVYPSNPFTLQISPIGRPIYNGSVRPAWDGRSWTVGVNLSFVNGESRTVRLNRNVTCKFWDNGVGGTLVDEQIFAWFEEIRVTPFGTYNAWFTTTSPSGNRVFEYFENMEDMTMELIFTKDDGRMVKATIQCRIMAGFGINIIEVGSYTSSERRRILNDRMTALAIYENHGITFSSVDYVQISNADAGGYTVLNDVEDYEDLLKEFSVSNRSVDCFLVRDMWGSVIGRSPIGGWDYKGTECGIARDGLAVEYPMIALAHELGHYIGNFDHLDVSGNVMTTNYSSTGVNFTHEQYVSLLNHNWTRIVR